MATSGEEPFRGVPQSSSLEGVLCVDQKYMVNVTECQKQMTDSPHSSPFWLLVRIIWRIYLQGCYSSLAYIPPPLPVTCME